MYEIWFTQCLWPGVLTFVLWYQDSLRFFKWVSSRERSMNKREVWIPQLLHALNRTTVSAAPWVCREGQRPCTGARCGKPHFGEKATGGEQKELWPGLATFPKCCAKSLRLLDRRRCWSKKSVRCLNAYLPSESVQQPSWAHHGRSRTCWRNGMSCSATSAAQTPGGSG